MGWNDVVSFLSFRTISSPASTSTFIKHTGRHSVSYALCKPCRMEVLLKCSLVCSDGLLYSLYRL
eukprot:jgi/Botrbrau1/9022/Bobra.0148s0122.1